MGEFLDVCVILLPTRVRRECWPECITFLQPQQQSNICRSGGWSTIIINSNNKTLTLYFFAQFGVGSFIVVIILLLFLIQFVFLSLAFFFCGFSFIIRYGVVFCCFIVSHCLFCYLFSVENSRLRVIVRERGLFLSHTYININIYCRTDYELESSLLLVFSTNLVALSLCRYLLSFVSSRELSFSAIVLSFGFLLHLSNIFCSSVDDRWKIALLLFYVLLCVSSLLSVMVAYGQ